MKIIEQKYEIGTVINGNTGDYEVLDYYKKYYEEDGKMRSRNYYSCRCLKDRYIFERTNKEIDNKIGCPVCSGKKILYGINSLADLRPDLVPYFIDQELPKMIALRSNIYSDMKCPDCGFEKNMCINNLAKAGFSCPICSDGISYPNKFVRALLTQLNVNYEPEKTFDWGKQYHYDQYLPDYNMIIENDGNQHFRDDAFGSGRDEAKIDHQKEILALDNDISIFVRLDCSFSNCKYIKNSIMRSLLPEILHFTEEDIDWKECEDIANSSLVHEIWDLWNNGVSAYEIQDKLKVSKFTIRNYINRGYDIGICHERCYFKKDKREIKGNNGNHLFTIKPLYCYEENSYYVSSSEYIKMHSRDSLVVGSINRAAKNQITYKGKHFKYITKQEFNNFKLLSLNNPDIKVYGELIDTKYL